MTKSRPTVSMPNESAAASRYRHVSIGIPTSGNYIYRQVAQEDIKTIDELLADPSQIESVKKYTIFRSLGGAISDGLAKSEIQRCGFEREDWENAIRDGLKPPGDNSFARAAYVLLACKNLEVICTKLLSYAALGTFARKVIERAAETHLQARLQQQPPSYPDLLAHVREIRIERSEAAFLQNNIEDARTLLCLPALHKLTLDNLHDYVRDGEAPAQDEIIRNTNALSLVFENCKLSTQGLQTVLASCAHLTALTVIWSAWQSRKISISKVCDVLRARGRDLEMLHFDPVNVIDGGHEGHARVKGTFGSFAGFAKMRCLAVPKDFFNHLLDIPAVERAAQASRILPPELKELYILGVEPDEKAEVEAMVGVSAIPRLEKSVCILWKHDVIYDLRGNLPWRGVDYESLGEYDPF